MTIAAELWVRGQIGTVNTVFASVARRFTVRLAEVLADYLSSLMRKAESLATPETECLLYATYWLRPILSELIGAAVETCEANRARAPSGPVKAVVSQQPHVRHHAGIEVHAGISALLAWFSASWASKIAAVFIGSDGGKIPPQVINIPCPNRVWDGTQTIAEALTLQAVRFLDENVDGLALGIEDELLDANSFAEVVRGYTSGIVTPYMMHGFLPVSAIRVSLDVIIPSLKGLTPERWKQTATLCPLDWPSNYSLLRLWHITEDLHEFVATLDKQMKHRHMFASWSIDHGKFMNRAIFSQPPNYLSEAALQYHLRVKTFPDRRVRTKAPRADVEAYHRKCEWLRQNAAAREQQQPVSFALRNSWADTLAADKTHYKEFTAKSQT